MKVLAILSQKGGVGKTTLATCLAVAAEQAGKVAAIIDLDLSALSALPQALQRYNEVSRHPQVRRDLAVVLDSAQPAGDVVTAIKLGIHDQALPTDRGPRFLEIHPHDKEHLVCNLFGKPCKACCVLLSRLHIMDGAGANDQKNPGILPVQDFFDGKPAA